MTDVQLAKLKKSAAVGGGYPSTLQDEINCIEMINSILAYEWVDKKLTAIDIYEQDKKQSHSYLGRYTALFGAQKVVKLIQEQMDSIAEIKTNVCTDSEGLSYNSIIWKEY